MRISALPEAVYLLLFPFLSSSSSLFLKARTVIYLIRGGEPDGPKARWAQPRESFRRPPRALRVHCAGQVLIGELAGVSALPQSPSDRPLFSQNQLLPHISGGSQLGCSNVAVYLQFTAWWGSAGGRGVGWWS